MATSEPQGGMITSPTCGRGRREAAGEGVVALNSFCPHPPCGHLLPEREKGFLNGMITSPTCGRGRREAAGEGDCGTELILPSSALRAPSPGTGEGISERNDHLSHLWERSTRSGG